MEVQIRSRYLEVTSALREAAEDKVTRLARHLDGWDEAEIAFIEERNPRIADSDICEITLRGHGHILRAKAASSDPIASVDKAIAKLTPQMEKLKGRLLHRRDHDSLRYRQVNEVDGLSPDGGDDGSDEPRIVKSKRFELKPMTPEEAALRMDMLGHTFFFFTNAESEAPAVVYRRDDGDVGLIDAH